MAIRTRRAAHLDAIFNASQALTSDLDLNHVLQTVVDLSRSLVNARYAALGVLNEEGTEIAQFVTAGVSDELRAHIGPFPRGRGLLGAIIQEGQTIRVNDIGADNRSVPGPSPHPHMHTFLGVPIVSKGRVLGNLYLTDKLNDEGHGASGRGGASTGSASEDAASRNTAKPPPFTEDDEATLELFAMQAAIAIENALLRRRSEQLVIAKERERFAMDLHDGIIQSIYAVGLALDDGRFYLESDPRRAHTRIDQAIDELNTVIADLRSYIMNLEPQRFRERDLAIGLVELARELRATSFLKVETGIDEQAAADVSSEQTRELLHIAKEAIANAHRHARCATVRIELTLADQTLQLTIIDDGVGLETSTPTDGDGRGLANMRERAELIGGSLSIESHVGRGTNVTVMIPPETFRPETTV